jgi:hypothetical protein
MSEQQPPPEGRRPISLEGKIGIFLALVGLFGAGAVMVAPQQVWIGWTLIGVAAIGFVLLFVHHVSSAVAPSRPKPSRPSGMTVADAGFLVSLGAAGVVLIAAGMRHKWAAIIAAIVACLAVSFDFVDRQWFENAAPAQAPLSADNAKLEVRAWTGIVLSQTPAQTTPAQTPDQTPVPTPAPTQTPKQYAANIFTINKGKHDAIGMRHYGIVMLAGTELTDAAVSALYPMLKAEIAISEPPTKARIEAGSDNVWFSVFSGELSDKQFDAVSKNAMIPYVLTVMQYRDDLTPPDKYIYTESCAYFLAGAVHICPRGDNVTYISD